jgi:hypothetical protein
MKTKKAEKKLTLSKITVANLEISVLNKVQGGLPATNHRGSCISLCFSICTYYPCQ